MGRLLRYDHLSALHVAASDTNIAEILRYMILYYYMSRES